MGSFRGLPGTTSGCGCTGVVEMSSMVQRAGCVASLRGPQTVRDASSVLPGTQEFDAVRGSSKGGLANQDGFQVPSKNQSRASPMRRTLVSFGTKPADGISRAPAGASPGGACPGGCGCPAMAAGGWEQPGLSAGLARCSLLEP